MAENNYRQARRAEQKVLELDPRSAEAEAMTGAAEFGLGELEAARKELERAVQLDPHSSAAYYPLGIVYRKAGEPVLAQQALAKFQELKAQERKNLDREQIQGFLERARPRREEP